MFYIIFFIEGLKFECSNTNTYFTLLVSESVTMFYSIKKKKMNELIFTGCEMFVWTFHFKILYKQPSKCKVALYRKCNLDAYMLKNCHH